MAIRFAKQAGNWSDPNTWEDGLTIPTTGDQVFLNSYNVTIDQNVTVGSISNTTTFVGLPGSIIPNMTSNTSPSGVGQAFSTQDSSDAWIPFAKDFLAPSGNWNAGSFSGNLGFQFDTPKNIQRYSWSQSYTQAAPRIWTFEASNDGVSWTIIHTVSTNYSGGSYYSPVISNPSSYTYYRINVGGVQGSQYLGIVLFDMTESTSLTNGWGVNGTATVNDGLTITADFYPRFVNLFTVPALSPNQVTFIGNAPGTVVGSGSSNPALINATGTGTINYIGNIRATYQNAMGRGIQLASGTTLNFTGDILGSRVLNTFSPSNSQGIICGVGSTVNIVGSITASETGIWNRGINTASNAIVNITGNVDGGVGTDPIRACNGVNLNGGLVTIVGNVYAGPNTIGVEGSGSNTAQVKITGNLYNWTDGTMAAFTKFLFLESANMQWNFKKYDLTDNILYTPGVNTGHPAEANVRTGIVYGPTNNLTGTCAVPPAAAVSIGVPIDNTVGTAYLNPTDIWNVPLASITTPNSIGERLKDASTVQSTGAQLAAFL